MNQNTQKSFTEWLRRNEWNIVLIIAIIAFGLGAAGIRQQQNIAGRPINWADTIYFSLRLFTFSYDLAGDGTPYAPSPAALYAAKFLAPLSVFYAAIKGILSLAQQRLELWRIRRWRNHALVFGAGRRGRLVALNLVQSGHRVVVVEKDENNECLAELRAAGVKVIIGNAVDAVCQEQARIEQASLVMALTASEEANLEVALSASRRCLNRSVLIQAHVSRHFAEEFESHPPFDKIRKGVHARFFDHTAAAARLLFREFGRKLLKPAGAPVDAPTFLLLGDGEILMELLKTLVVQAQYAGAKVPAVHIMTTSDTFLRRFPAQHPQLPLVCSIQLVELAGSALTQLGQNAAIETTAFDLAFVAFDHDAETMAASRHLMQLNPALHGRVVACLRPSSNMLGLLAVKEPIAGVVFRDIVELGCQTGVLIQGEQDQVAKSIHDRYVATEQKRGQTAATNPSLVAWEDLTEALRQANRAQADHMEIKLATLKRSQDPATIELLTEAEHRRWMAEKVISGWRHGADRDNTRKLHPSIKPFDQLSEAEKQKDRDTVLALTAKKDL